MASTRQCLVSVLVLLVLICIQTTKSNVIKVENIANEKVADSSQEQLTLTDDSVAVTQQGKREKRWFDPYGFGLAPFFPPIAPSFAKRDDSFETGVYGLDDQLPHILRKLQEVNSYVKQPSYNNYPQAPVVPPIPFFVPIFYVPNGGCTCTDSSTEQVQETITSRPTAQTPRNNEVPGVETRLPEMEDKRQNWGIVVNNTQPEDDSYFDSRPLSFEPLGPPPTGPSFRPPPPVDHGSSQEDTSSAAQPTEPPSTPKPSPPQASSPSPGLPSSLPSSCDGAILTCCHQPQITIECFESNGCPDPLALGRPCDTEAILNAINRYQKFYGQSV